MSEEEGEKLESAAGLRSLREEELGPEPAGRRQFELAALEASGEVGYRHLTVQRILDRAGLSRPRFYRTYDDKAECYAEAYDTAAERLAGTLLAAGEGEGWVAGFRAALTELAGFLDSEPLLARGLLAEVHVAGGAALAKRKEVFERLSRAVDAARRETPASRHSPPPITAAFILCAIEEAVVRAAMRNSPAEFTAALPDLTYLATVPYFGRERALAEFEDS
jgi:AcrR family transcriptional regulator